MHQLQFRSVPRPQKIKQAHKGNQWQVHGSLPHTTGQLQKEEGGEEEDDEAKGGGGGGGEGGGEGGGGRRRVQIWANQPNKSESSPTPTSWVTRKTIQTGKKLP